MKTKTKKLKLGLFALGILGLSLSSCKKDDEQVNVPAPDQNEVELITTFKITLTDDANVQPTVSATFQDLDGNGGNGPGIFDTIVLAPNTSYSAKILLLNETVTPVDTISNEVKDEDDQHLFCFEPSNGLNLTIVRTDTDGTYEVGLESQWVTSSASTGTTLITLRHQPGVKDGTCTPGETDIEVNFVTKIQ